ncbi:MAG TPA: hypothetical protein VGM54_18375 [Chthoniobacter sp.]|jgi:hypothetical protein
MPIDSIRRVFFSREFIALAVVILALRIAYAVGLRFDVDEPQHVHVVWAWATGRLPYRDVFDNHAPLFQFLYAPIFRLIPERADIVIPMRWAMLPLYALVVFAVYRLAAVFYSRNLALLIAISGSLLPRYFLKSVEFRPDNLWAAVWFLCLAILVQRPLTIRRALWFGLCLGVSWSTSLKTTLLVLTLGLSLAMLLVLKACDKNSRIPWKLLVQCISVATLATLLLPGVITVWFWLKGLWPQFYYGLIGHNVIPQLKHWRDPGYAHWWFPVTLAGLVVCATLLCRFCPKPELRDRMVFTFLLPGCYALLLYGFWPDIPREDDLPLYPLIPLSACLLGGALLPKAGRDLVQRFSTGLAWSVIILQIGWLMLSQRPWHRQNKDQIADISTILQLVNPDEFVMDPVAGAVYRRRPYFYALETITKTRIRFGLTPDNIRQCLIDTGTKVAMPEGIWHYTKSRLFVDGNYVPLKHQDGIRVAGQYLVKDASKADNGYHFEVVIPAKYSIVDDRGRLAGTLDGTPCDGPRELAAGPHEFRPAGQPSELALFWDRALEKGYRPEFTDPETAPRKVKPRS